MLQKVYITKHTIHDIRKYITVVPHYETVMQSQYINKKTHYC